jgi:hypothetical protein
MGSSSARSARVWLEMSARMALKQAIGAYAKLRPEAAI